MRLFLKLGGSLLTDKTQAEALRTATVARLAQEIAAARAANPQLELVLGHGSGSFGHVAAAQYGTRSGVRDAAGWHGFAVVADAAARLNAAVRAALLAAGVPVVSVAPSGSAETLDGALQQLAVKPVEAALAAGLVPLVYGDVAFDRVRGGTIVSTEEVLGFLAGPLRPDWLLLAGETNGVYDSAGVTIPVITRSNLATVSDALGGSRGTDVTGGMASKVHAMLDLVDAHPGLAIRIFSGLAQGELALLLTQPDAPLGTRISRD